MYWVSVVTEAGIFAILALGLDVIWGWAGDFDLAFYGYLALGSYLTFVLTIGKPTPPVEYILGYHLPVVLAIALAMVAVVGLAAVIGAIALRNLREIYFAVTTLGAVSALYLLVENYTPLFDGYNGVYGLINPGQTALNLTYNGYRIQQHLRPVRRLPGQCGGHRAAGVRDVSERAGGSHAVASQPNGKGCDGGPTGRSARARPGPGARRAVRGDAPGRPGRRGDQGGEAWRGR